MNGAIRNVKAGRRRRVSGEGGDLVDVVGVVDDRLYRYSVSPARVSCLQEMRLQHY